jgi:hypothetical protein
MRTTAIGNVFWENWRRVAVHSICNEMRESLNASLYQEKINLTWHKNAMDVKALP